MKKQYMEPECNISAYILDTAISLSMDGVDPDVNGVQPDF